MNPPPPDSATRPAPPEGLRERLLTATAEVAAVLIRGTEAASFDRALRLLGEAAAVSRVYVFEVGTDAHGGVACWQRHEWCAPGVAPQIDNPDLQGFALEPGHARWLRAFEADQPVFGDVEAFPPEEQAVLRAQAIVSLAVMPVQIEHRLWGFIGFDECHTPAKWTREVIDCLGITARVLAGAIDRMHFRRRRDEIMADHEQLIASLDDIVFRFDARGNWTFLSPAWSKRLGWAVADCLGQPAVRYVFKSDRALTLRSWQHVVAGRQQSFRGEVRFQEVGGGLRWMLVSARAQRDRAGAVTGVTGTLTDVTAAKTAEAELIAARTAAEKANKAKSEFLSTMSHELRTPLNAVIGLAESLLDLGGSLDPARTRRYLEIIHGSGRQLLAQINDILDFARLESGRTELDPVLFELDALVAAVVAANATEARAKQLDVRVTRAPGAIRVRADERLLQQALHNLVANAVKFTPAGGSILLETALAPTGGPCVRVRDSGIGIPADKQDRLFQPFFQADASLSRQHGGTGLGLSLVERIVRLHGGRVTVQSAPGAGSTFTLELPRAVLEAPARRLAPAPGVRTVLVVDDDVHQHTLVGDYLRRHGLDVLYAENAEAALPLVERGPLALALIDISLPGMSGFELIARLRAAPATRELPILAVTALAGPEDAERCRAVGADSFLAKPISLRELAQQIAALTGLIS